MNSAKCRDKTSKDLFCRTFAMFQKPFAKWQDLVILSLSDLKFRRLQSRLGLELFIFTVFDCFVLLS